MGEGARRLRRVWRAENEIREGLVIEGRRLADIAGAWLVGYGKKC